MPKWALAPSLPSFITKTHRSQSALTNSEPDTYLNLCLSISWKAFKPLVNINLSQTKTHRVSGEITGVKCKLENTIKREMKIEWLETTYLIRSRIMSYFLAKEKDCKVSLAWCANQEACSFGLLNKLRIFCSGGGLLPLDILQTKTWFSSQCNDLCSRTALTNTVATIRSKRYLRLLMVTAWHGLARFVEDSSLFLRTNNSKLHFFWTCMLWWQKSISFSLRIFILRQYVA